jgi:hypothetical protein
MRRRVEMPPDKIKGMSDVDIPSLLEGQDSIRPNQLNTLYVGELVFTNSGRTFSQKSP